MNNLIISKERKEYIKKNKRKKRLVTVAQILILVIFLGVWELLANAKIIDSFITSQPSRILKTFLNLSSNDLLEHLKITCIETILGFSLGTIFGGIIAMILWW